MQGTLVSPWPLPMPHLQPAPNRVLGCSGLLQREKPRGGCLNRKNKKNKKDPRSREGFGKEAEGQLARAPQPGDYYLSMLGSGPHHLETPPGLQVLQLQWTDLGPSSSPRPWA